MAAAANPFSYHPDLRDKISDPLTSPLRTFTTAKVATIAKARGLPVDWWYSDSEREAERAETLAGHRDTDFWVFAYGSLMWDPALRFEEVRRAHVPGYARYLILKDIYGGRGTVDAPGLMAALAKGRKVQLLELDPFGSQIHLYLQVLVVGPSVVAHRPGYTALLLYEPDGNFEIIARREPVEHSV